MTACVRHGSTITHRRAVSVEMNTTTQLCVTENRESFVLDCHCVTYDRQSGSTYLGLCFYNCKNNKFQERIDYVYKKLPQKSEDLLNRSVCTHFHRTGLLCGDCEERHSPLVFSYNLSCVTWD